MIWALSRRMAVQIAPWEEFCSGILNLLCFSRGPNLFENIVTGFFGRGGDGSDLLTAYPDGLLAIEYINTFNYVTIHIYEQRNSKVSLIKSRQAFSDCEKCSTNRFDDKTSMTLEQRSRDRRMYTIRAVVTPAELK